MQDRTMSIVDVGPIATLRLVVPEDGGLVELKGWNGVGKSEALKAARALLEGHGTLAQRDGTVGGSVEGLGVSLRVGRRTTRSGELEVISLDGDDLQTFVDPRKVGAEAADADRANALCRLAKIPASLEPFAKLLGGEEALRAVADPKSLSLDSLPEMAAGIKRGIENKARSVEALEKNERGRAAGLRQALQGVDLSVQMDERELSTALEAAIREQAALATQARSAEAARKANGEASTSLAAARERFTGISVETARANLAGAADAEARAWVSVEEAEALRLSRREQHAVAKRIREAAETEVARADEHVRMVRGWEETIAASSGARPAPTAEETASASAKVDAAREALQRGAVARKLQAQSREAEAASKAAADLDKEAGRLRDLAAACEDVVTEAIRRVAPRGIKMKQGRLVLETTRGETYFADLSKGERTIIGVHAYVDAAGEGGVLTMPQELNEGLDPRARAEVDAAAKARRTVILTAAAAEGDLRAEAFRPGATP